MAQAPAMPVFTDALLGDTTHLSAEEFGAYCLLLFVTWRNNGAPLPDDNKRLARVCRVTERRWTGSLRATLATFFDVSGGTWRQKRLEKEWQICTNLSAIQRAKANARWNINSLRNNNTDNAAASAGQVPEPCPQTQTQKEDSSLRSESAPHVKDATDGRSKRGTRLAPDWQPNGADREFAGRFGLDPDAVTAEFRDHWCGVPGSKGVKLDWSGTFRNRCRYIAEHRPRPVNGRRHGPATGLFEGAAMLLADIEREERQRAADLGTDINAA